MLGEIHSEYLKRYPEFIPLTPTQLPRGKKEKLPANICCPSTPTSTDSASSTQVLTRDSTKPKQDEL